jgi:hypothetical protein
MLQLPNRKLARITSLWREGVGVVSLHVFQNTPAVEALTREAAMIDAIGAPLSLTCNLHCLLPCRNGELDEYEEGRISRRVEAMADRSEDRIRRLPPAQSTASAARGGREADSAPSYRILIRPSSCQPSFRILRGIFQHFLSFIYRLSYFHVKYYCNCDFIFVFAFASRPIDISCFLLACLLFPDRDLQAMRKSSSDDDSDDLNERCRSLLTSSHRATLTSRDDSVPVLDGIPALEVFACERPTMWQLYGDLQDRRIVVRVLSAEAAGVVVQPVCTRETPKRHLEMLRFEVPPHFPQSGASVPPRFAGLHVVRRLGQLP